MVMELTNEISPVTSYDVSVMPHAEEIWYTRFIGSIDVEMRLTLLYNTLYNVSVSAITCGLRHGSSNTVVLYYSECIHAW